MHDVCNIMIKKAICVEGGKNMDCHATLFLFPTRLRLIEVSIQYIIFQYDM